MSDTPKARLILPDDLTRDDFRALARSGGWVQHKVYDTPGENYEEVWANADQTAALHYVEDNTISRERFLTLRSDSVQARLPDLARTFRTVPISDLYQRIVYNKGEDLEQLIRALNQLGVVASDMPRDVQVAWETGLFHPDEHVRLSTIRAMSYQGLPDVVPLLDEAVREDPSLEVQELAGDLIASIRRHNPDAWKDGFTFTSDRDAT